ncbi:MAG TPA: hypothetical protein VEC16_00265 [Alphaproteobacteria bacterium]|nr:hypothetical protein [Alphaproteobacteria bacterium]
MNTYRADFRIDNGKKSHETIPASQYERLGELIEGTNDIQALGKAAMLAYKLSLEDDHVAKDTIVTITRLYTSSQRTIDQKAIVKSRGEEGIRGFEWEDNNLKITSTSLEKRLYSIRKNQ